MADSDALPVGNDYYLFPEWFGRNRAPEALSPQLSERLSHWNQIWENELNPVTELRWPDALIGWDWIAEGDELVRLIQAELGDDIRVLERFHKYAPEL